MKISGHLTRGNVTLEVETSAYIQEQASIFFHAEEIDKRRNIARNIVRCIFGMVTQFTPPKSRFLGKSSTRNGGRRLCTPKACSSPMRNRLPQADNKALPVFSGQAILPEDADNFFLVVRQKFDALEKSRLKFQFCMSSLKRATNALSIPTSGSCGSEQGPILIGPRFHRATVEF